jgi:hypothetical protein
MSYGRKYMHTNEPQLLKNSEWNENFKLNKNDKTIQSVQRQLKIKYI